MGTPVNLYLLVEAGFAWIWEDTNTVPAWKFTIGNPRRQIRRWRMLRNAVDAYREMLHGAAGESPIQVVLGASDENPALEPIQYVRVSVEELQYKRDANNAHTLKIHTPFVSRQEIDWSACPDMIRDNHVYVDASFYQDGPNGVPVASYAIHAQGQTYAYELKTAMSSVDAEVQGLQHAIMLAYKQADATKQKITVFADCCAALTKIILREESTAFQYLGEKVFVQWTPGHDRAVEGMKMVDRAAREKVRELAGIYED